MNLLVELEKGQTVRNELIDQWEDPYKDGVDPVLLELFISSYMKPLSDEAKIYCREGHALERPFLKQFHQHSVDGRTLGYNSLRISETPLVESSFMRGVLDSSDAEFLYEKDGHIGTIPVEIKARVAHIDLLFRTQSSRSKSWPYNFRERGAGLRRD